MGNERIFGGLGSAFIILSFIPYIGWLLGIAGIVLLFIAFHKFSEIFGDKNIFNKFLTGFLISIAGIIVFFLFGIFSFIPVLISAKHGAGEHISFDLGMFGIGIIFALIVFYIINIVAANYYRHCFNLMAEYTNINLFRLAGIFVFWGAVGLIVFGLGAIAILVGWILLTVAFFSIPRSYDMPREI
ncbi:MAG: DUF996 domain-containing protein [Thermodesulfovibrio sp.]|nr:DUF996 domain-containing protein [Thermodesulfovibrio sp.]